MSHGCVPGEAGRVWRGAGVNETSQCSSLSPGDRGDQGWGEPSVGVSGSRRLLLNRGGATVGGLPHRNRSNRAILG
jgi:hypothetical protein